MNYETEIKIKRYGLLVIFLYIVSFVFLYGNNTGEFKKVYEHEIGSVHQELEVGFIQAISFKILSGPSLTGNYKILINTRKEGCYVDPTGDHMPKLVMKNLTEEVFLGFESFSCEKTWNLEEKKKVIKILKHFLRSKYHL